MERLISWVEIPAENFERAVKFYTKVFGLEMQIFEYEREKMACFPSGEGAISYAEGFRPSSDGVLVSLDAGNELEKTMRSIEENGGKIVHPKTKIEVEGRDYFALFIDSEGNKIGLYGDN